MLRGARGHAPRLRGRGSGWVGWGSGSWRCGLGGWEDCGGGLRHLADGEDGICSLREVWVGVGRYLGLASCANVVVGENIGDP